MRQVFRSGLEVVRKLRNKVRWNLLALCLKMRREGEGRIISGQPA